MSGDFSQLYCASPKILWEYPDQKTHARNEIVSEVATTAQCWPVDECRRVQRSADRLETIAAFSARDLRAECTQGIVKVAVTARCEFIENEQVPVPEQPAPLQPANVEPNPGVAVRTTLVPFR